MTKKGISDEERAYFRNAMSDVTPLEKNQPEKEPLPEEKPQPETTEKPLKKIVLQPRMAMEFEKPAFRHSDTQATISSEDILSFSRDGLQHKRFTQLRQGKTRPEATLDLHEHTSDQAIHATDAFLKRCHERHIRYACIIHGKGLYSTDNKPVIKNLLNHYLRQHPLVIAFHSAKNKDGGAGALYLIIKSK